MNAYQNIQLSFKCPKALDELQPCESNWYCDGCRKMVYDFRGMEEEQILDTFAKSGQRLCGIYDADRIKVLPQQPRWYKWASAAVMALGVMVLNSCGFGGKEKTITTMGVLLPSPPAEKTLMGAPPVLKKDTLAQPPLIKHSVCKDPPNFAMGDAQVLKLKLNPAEAVIDEPNPADSSNVVLGGAETEPFYPGGETEFAKYMATQIKYDGNRQGRAFAQFVVEKDGSLADIKILRSIAPDIDEQIIAALKNCKKWQPGSLNGKPTRVQYTIPFNFPEVKK